MSSPRATIEQKPATFGVANNHDVAVLPSQQFFVSSPELAFWLADFREEILHLPPETIARAGEGDEAAMRTCDEQRFKDGKHTCSEQRPSMGQDMQKGRRTEIEFLNGFVVRGGEKVGLSCGANAVLTDIVKRVECNELSPDPRHITELRLN